MICRNDPKPLVRACLRGLPQRPAPQGAVWRELAALRGKPGSQLVELPKAGHFANMEEPTAFNRVLKEFLYSLTGLGQQGR